MKTQRMTVTLTFAMSSLVLAMMVVSMFCASDDYCKSYGFLFILTVATGILDIIVGVLIPNMKRYSSIDLMVFCLVIALTACHLHNRAPSGELRLISIVMTFIVFHGTRLLNEELFELFDKILFAGLSCVVLWQVFLGLFQTVGVLQSNSTLFCCTGSFTNPGPYGGFMAMSAAGLTVWSRGKTGIVFTFGRIAAIAAIVAVAASASRAAFLSVAVCAVFLLFNSPDFKAKARAIRLSKPYRFALYSVLSAVVISVMSFSLYNMKKGSADSRILIDKICVRAIAGGPLFGRGLGSFPATYANAQSDYFSCGEYSENERLLADSPAKAFNEFLEIGVEAGPVVMAVVVLLAIVSLAVLLNRQSPFGYMLLVLTVFSLFSYPLIFMQFRVLMAICVARAAALMVRDGKSVKLSPIVGTVAFFPVLTGVFLMRCPLLQHIRASEEWHELSPLYDSGLYVAVCDRYAKLHELMKHNSEFLSQYGISLAAVGDYDKSDSVLRDFILTSSDPVAYNRMAENSYERGDFLQSELLFRKSFAMVPNRIIPLAGTARSIYAQGDLDRFKQLADSISFFVPKVESATTAGIREDIARLYIEIR